ncbi:MAG: YggS family pyridoxal phosphate-dependent enzyme [Oscillospiraceae bacterium]|nr:YggS family pyridoxal phosphate-dependent enzyme [Oscillospiraceae bacterium]MBQ4315838.1 YggS family pyridoxal phosphate-dependent enzyme [Oscillospiraceae bacterium]MBR2181181.1 YggS family pyridoxal phosphate-dependent enzyme [Oscillospiraceae bacterium]
MSSISENIQNIRREIDEAARLTGRTGADITLVAATKMNGAERVREAVAAGIDACGENRVQELLEKYEDGAYAGAPLHFIGTLQTNKVKYLVGKVSLIQSVNSEKLAAEISKCAIKHGIVQDILVEINIGGEESKSGADIENAHSLVQNIAKLPGVRVRGLMTIPPFSEDEEEQKSFFIKMKQLFIDIGAKKYDNISMEFLSMGMSGDYRNAILCGANMVRVGTGIFGARHY